MQERAEGDAEMDGGAAESPAHDGGLELGSLRRVLSQGRGLGVVSPYQYFPDGDCPWGGS